MANPDSRDRAEAELIADPRRSDYLIAEIVRCSPSQVGHWRHQLEQAGQIGVIPVRERRQRDSPAADTGAADYVAESGPHRGRYRVSDSRPPAGFYAPVDRDVDGWCCTRIWRDAQWVHGLACPFRRQSATAR